MIGKIVPSPWNLHLRSDKLGQRNSIMNVRKNYDIFDLTKFILSLFIVAIHNSIIPDILSPCARIAVPLFFMISSYLFFERKSKIIDTSRGGGTI